MKNAYLIGIGGVGMSSLARHFASRGINVSGYDRDCSEMTESLENEGIRIRYDADPASLPSDIGETLVIYTPAIPEDSCLLEYARRQVYAVMKRAQALGTITKGKHCLAVSGTHGKTTTTTLAAHILMESGEGCMAFLGGVSRNYGTNYLAGNGGAVVVEADEYDRAFLELNPDIAVITGVEPDHLDSYGDYDGLVMAFRAFAGQVSGTLIVKKGAPVDASDTAAQLLTYHLSDPDADFHAEHIRPAGRGLFVFDLVHPGGVLRDIRTGVPGLVNVENGVAAAAAALSHGVDPEAARSAICSFKGVKRRLEMHVDTPAAAFVDDYAHHPTELRVSIEAVKEMFPGRHITAVFQPHLYSRTKALAADFGRALSQADKVVLLDIYPAREDPVPGVGPDLIFQETDCPDKVIIKKEGLLDYVKREAADVLVTFGAGDISKYVTPIKNLFYPKMTADW